MNGAWQEEVLGFWFGELTPENWWSGGSEVDDKVQRFAGLQAEIAAREPAGLPSSPHEALAAVIVLDQFPRNLFRKTARAFATDGKALAVAKAALEKSFDKALSAEEVPFLLMPFMHSEHPADQQRSVELFEALGVESNANYARIHRDIIERFGRFPHRNRALGRTSTEEELSFLAEHEGFGQ